MGVGVIEMGVIAIDIETYADVPEWIQDRWKEREVKAPSNWKDPIKCQRYVEEKMAERIEKAALNPLTGRVVGVGVGHREKEDWEYACWVDRVNNEASLLKAVDYALGQIPGLSWLVTYNGRQFDFPFLAVRAMRHKLDLRHRWPLGKWDRRHVDMFDAFGKNGSLAAWGQLLLDENPVGSGKHIGELVAAEEWDEIEAHCLQDVKIVAGLWELYERTVLGGYDGKVSGTS